MIHHWTGTIQIDDEDIEVEVRYRYIPAEPAVNLGHGDIYPGCSADIGFIDIVDIRNGSRLHIEGVAEFDLFDRIIEEHVEE